jgi:hypothetical protein
VGLVFDDVGFRCNCATQYADYNKDDRDSHNCGSSIKFVFATPDRRFSRE